MNSHIVRVAEYDVFDKKWHARGKVLHGGTVTNDYIDYVMRNKWTPGACYGRAIYRVNLPGCHRRYYYRGESIGYARFVQLIEQGGDYCERQALGGDA